MHLVEMQEAMLEDEVLSKSFGNAVARFKRAREFKAVSNAGKPSRVEGFVRRRQRKVLDREMSRMVAGKRPGDPADYNGSMAPRWNGSPNPFFNNKKYVSFVGSTSGSGNVPSINSVRRKTIMEHQRNHTRDVRRNSQRTLEKERGVGAFVPKPKPVVDDWFV